MSAARVNVVIIRSPAISTKGIKVLEIRVGIELASLRLPFRKALLTAAQMGVQGVEIDARQELSPEELTQSGIRHVRKILEDFNLRVATVRFRTRNGYHVQQGLDRRIEATKNALKLAYDLGAGILINHIGKIPAEDDVPGNTLLNSVLTDIGQHAQRVGAMLVAETGTDSGAELARLIDAVPQGSLGLDFNPAELVLNSLSPQEILTAVGRHVLNVHVADATRDVSLRRGYEVALGRGSVDWPELLGMLEERDYRGWFILQRRDSSNPVLDLSDALRYLRAL